MNSCNFNGSSLTSCATTTITATVTQAGLLLCVIRVGQGAVWTVDLSSATVRQLCFFICLVENIYL